MIPAIAMGVGALSGLSSLAGGLMGSSAASKAASQQAQAIQQGIDYQKGIYNDARGNLNPYILSGQQNLNTYQNMLGSSEQPGMKYNQLAFDFNKYKDPSAQYAMDQSARAMEASALAKGATGGGFAKSLQQNQNNLANQAYANAFQRWQDTSKMMYGQAADQYGRDYSYQQNLLGQYGNLAGQGLNAAQALAGAGNTSAENIGNMYSGLGEAQASGTMGASGALSSGLGGLFGGFRRGIGDYFGYGSGQQNPYTTWQGLGVA